MHAFFAFPPALSTVQFFSFCNLQRPTAAVVVSYELAEKFRYGLQRMPVSLRIFLVVFVCFLFCLFVFPNKLLVIKIAEWIYLCMGPCNQQPVCVSSACYLSDQKCFKALLLPEPWKEVSRAGLGWLLIAMRLWFCRTLQLSLTRKRTKESNWLDSEAHIVSVDNDGVQKEGP